MSAATLVEVLIAALVLAGIGFAVVSALPVADADADEPPFPLPSGQVTPEAIDRARFPLAFRGYRMAEVDEVLERVAEAIAERDAEIARLTGPAPAPEALEPSAMPEIRDDAAVVARDPDSETLDGYDWQEFGAAPDTGA